MIKVIKFGLWSATIGLLYAVTSFYLLTPCLRNNVAVILFCGLQGFIFGISFFLLVKILSGRWLKRIKGIYLFTLIGIISGFFSTSYNVLMTLYGAFWSFDGTVSDIVVHSVVLELAHHVFGASLIGGFAGFVLYNIEKNKLDSQRLDRV